MAELLITLLLLGTIAALTVPDLYIKLEQAYFKSKYISTLSILNEATKRMKADNGGILNGVLGYDAIGLRKISSGHVYPDDCPQFILSNPSNSANPEDNIMEMYSRYLNWVKKYPAEEGRTGIFSYKSAWNNQVMDYSSKPILVLANGAAVVFWSGADTYACEATYSARERKDYKAKYNKPCIEDVPIDLNGPKGPNIKGRDVQFFSVYADRVATARMCRYDTTYQQKIENCTIRGWACPYFWMQGMNVYYGSS